MRRILVEAVALVVSAFLIDLALLTYHTPFWAVFLLTAVIFVGGDTYYQYIKAQGGHDDEQ